MSYEMVSAYTLLIGDADGPAAVSVHQSAAQVWTALGDAVYARSVVRPLHADTELDADSAAALADAWRAEDPATRYWSVTAHRLPVHMPVIARPAVVRVPAQRTASPAPFVPVAGIA